MVASCAEKTYAGTTIADVVSRAAVSRTTFYKLFNGKRDCFDAAATHCIDRIAADRRRGGVGVRIARRGDPQGAAAMLELLAAEPELALVLGGDVVGVDPGLVERYCAFAGPGAGSGSGSAKGRRRPKHLSPGPRLRAGPAPRLPRGRRRAPRAPPGPRPGHRLPGDRPVRRARRGAAPGAAGGRRGGGVSAPGASPRTPRAPTRGGGALPARAPARRRRPGHRRARLRGDDRRRHPRRGRGRAGDLLRTLRGPPRLRPRRPPGAAGRPRRPRAGRLRGPRRAGSSAAGRPCARCSSGSPGTRPWDASCWSSRPPSGPEFHASSRRASTASSR